MAFAEIHEGDAPPDIAALYARLRDAVGIPIVNLIWRHAATMPGVLAWMVEAAEPLIRSALMQEWRAAMARAGNAQGFAPFGEAARRLPVDAQDRLHSIIATYNRGNLTNLLTLTALRRAIAGSPTGGAPLAPSQTPTQMLPAIPAMPRLAQFPPELVAQIRALAALHTGIGDAIPSLYLHLALIPALLPPLHEALAPMAASGGLLAQRAAMIDKAAGMAPTLLAAIATNSPFPPAHAPAMLAALDSFAGGLIADMSAIGTGLAQHLGGEA